MCDNNGCEIPKTPSLSCHEQEGYDTSQNPYFPTLRLQSGSLSSGEGLNVVQCDSELMGICLPLWDLSSLSMFEWTKLFSWGDLEGLNR